MDPTKEWIRCSAVALGAYLIIYILLASAFFGYTNLWLIGIILVLAVGDVFGLRWLILRSENDNDNDPEP